eukprot:scaffold2383_cov161-Amphora_coffeaeformis.AAC.5
MRRNKLNSRHRMMFDVQRSTQFKSSESSLGVDVEIHIARCTAATPIEAYSVKDRVTHRGRAVRVKAFMPGKCFSEQPPPQTLQELFRIKARRKAQTDREAGATWTCESADVETRVSKMNFPLLQFASEDDCPSSIVRGVPPAGQCDANSTERGAAAARPCA